MGGAALPCGVFVGGDVMGANGNPVNTVTGCILGGGIGVLPNIISSHGEVDKTVVLVSITALLGGIVGFFYGIDLYGVVTNEEKHGYKMLSGRT